MLTHKQIRLWNIRNRKYHPEVFVKIIKARTPKDSNQIGIHLLNPSRDEIIEAYCKASNDLFPAIYVHTKRTWMKGK